MKPRLIILIPILFILISCSAKTEQNADTTKNSIELNTAVSYEIESRNYSKDEINITYPKIVNLDNDTYEDEINELIQKEAIKIIESYSLEEGNLDVDYRVTFRSNDFLSIQYLGSFFSTGAAHPLNIFYTSNIDLKKAEKVKLSDLLEINEAFVEKFKQGNYKSYDDNLNLLEEGVIEEIWSMYSDADLLHYLQQADEAGQINQLGTFSYITQDSIGVSISIPHAVGDHLEMEIGFVDVSENVKKDSVALDGLVEE